MHSPTCVSVVLCVVHKPRPCLSYSLRRDRINLVLLHSYYKGGGGYIYTFMRINTQVYSLYTLHVCTVFTDNIWVSRGRQVGILRTGVVFQRRSYHWSFASPTHSLLTWLHRLGKWTYAL